MPCVLVDFYCFMRYDHCFTQAMVVYVPKTVKTIVAGFLSAVKWVQDAIKSKVARLRAWIHMSLCIHLCMNVHDVDYGHIMS